MIRIYCKVPPVLSHRFLRLALPLMTAFLFAGTSVEAAEYVPYPGAYPARLKTVETPARFVFEVPVWTGFSRVFTITIPGIAVPRDSGGAPKCERELARRAKTFSESFLTEARRIEVRDITMEDSADTRAKALVFTNAGSLAEALRKGGFARSSDVASDTPWCDGK